MLGFSHGGSWCVSANTGRRDAALGWETGNGTELVMSKESQICKKTE